MRSKKRAPSTSRFDEIVAEIVHLLVSEVDPDKFAGTELVVRGSIQFLKVLAQGKPLWGLKQSNTDALTALLKNIDDLRKTLSGIPGKLLVLLTVERLSEQVPSSLEQQNASVRLEKIRATLGYLQTRCNDLLNQQPGEHGSADSSQRLIAEQTWRLMKYHNLKPASGLADSDYGVIASLLFEAVTGEEDKNLQRACKYVLKRAKDGELSEWRGDPIFKWRPDITFWNGKVE